MQPGYGIPGESKPLSPLLALWLIPSSCTIRYQMRYAEGFGMKGYACEFQIKGFQSFSQGGMGHHRKQVNGGSGVPPGGKITMWPNSQQAEFSNECNRHWCEFQYCCSCVHRPGCNFWAGAFCRSWRLCDFLNCSNSCSAFAETWSPWFQMLSLDLVNSCVVLFWKYRWV